MRRARARGPSRELGQTDIVVEVGEDLPRAEHRGSATSWSHPPRPSHLPTRRPTPDHMQMLSPRPTCRARPRLFLASPQRNSSPAPSRHRRASRSKHAGPNKDTTYRGKEQRQEQMLVRGRSMASPDVRADSEIHGPFHRLAAGRSAPSRHPPPGSKGRCSAWTWRGRRRRPAGSSTASWCRARAGWYPARACPAKPREQRNEVAREEEFDHIRIGERQVPGLQAHHVGSAKAGTCRRRRTSPRRESSRMIGGGIRVILSSSEVRKWLTNADIATP